MAIRKEAIKQGEQGRATVRALYLAELEDIGARRATALKAAEDQLERVARLLPSALDAGLSLSEISRLTDVSRPTLYQLRARHTAAAGNVRLAILQTVANHGWIERETLREELAVDPNGVDRAFAEMFDAGLLREEFNDDSQQPAMVYALTTEGFAELSDWTFEDDDASGAEA